MKKIVLTISAILPLTLSVAANANQDIDFSNPVSTYSYANLGYDSDGFTAGIAASQDFSNGSAMLEYIGANDFYQHNFIATLANSNRDAALQLDYLWDTDYRDTSKNSRTVFINALNTTSINSNFSLSPKVGLGLNNNDLSKNTSYLASAALTMTYAFNRVVWLDITPEYTYSFNDQKQKVGGKDSYRDSSIETNLGFKVTPNQFVETTYRYDENNDHYTGIRYNMRF
ncbi:Porin [Vibrio crassostreae]|uniref:Porin n=1 Tax=Vibrio crassostreae TaxID=246167 RepID=A0A4R3P5F8_9VIBR|nr:hypothetical protein [Vibrio crassostreae]MDH5952478.1 hypothetical protein [Vibrio crassostreae]ROO50031.1 hypothetical protein EDB58_11344 [Vibrio crassostreae]ROO77129.1 hypothetical protein EDB53_0963 [Vibrio crassostreae]ROR70168.1 hypothetical protein EDB59_0815 [Vibrio crassostreae]ROR75300.1 hypothetical protein EDB54_0807 [Vibrio crassostreae]